MKKRKWKKRDSEADPTRHRVTQGMVNRMAELRRQGLTFQEIGARVGCSERTARRKVGQVEPQINLPQRGPEPLAKFLLNPGLCPLGLHIHVHSNQNDDRYTWNHREHD